MSRLQFIAKAGDKARNAKDRSLDKACGSLLQKICQKYDNLNEIDKLASVTLKVDSVKLVMQDNVDLALQNCVKLESIEKAAGEDSIAYIYEYELYAAALAVFICIHSC